MVSRKVVNRNVVNCNVIICNAWSIATYSIAMWAIATWSIGTVDNHNVVKRDAPVKEKRKLCRAYCPLAEVTVNARVLSGSHSNRLFY